MLLKAQERQAYLNRLEDARIDLWKVTLEGQGAHTMLSEYGGMWLNAFRADGIMMVFNQDITSFGVVPAHQNIQSALQRLTRSFSGRQQFYCTDSIDTDPILSLMDFPKSICGLLAAPIPQKGGPENWILLFRTERVQTRYLMNSLNNVDLSNSSQCNSNENVDWMRERITRRSKPWSEEQILGLQDVAEDLAVVSSIYLVNQLNQQLQQERMALHRLNEELDRFAKTDPLTEISNRMAIENELVSAIKASERHHYPVSLLLFDVDFFKSINDTHGHPVGDLVLKTIAETISTRLRPSDHLGRWGGEEFLIVANHTSIEFAIKLAERVRLDVESIEIDGVAPVTVSIGVVQHSEGQSESHLVQLVDDALYRAKQNGRNRVEHN